jgi:hypothetical protein
VNKALKINGEVTNGAKMSIDASKPYIVHVQLRGAADLLMHRWNSEAVARTLGHLVGELLRGVGCCDARA